MPRRIDTVGGVRAVAQLMKQLANRLDGVAYISRDGEPLDVNGKRLPLDGYDVEESLSILVAYALEDPDAPYQCDSCGERYALEGEHCCPSRKGPRRAK